MLFSLYVEHLVNRFCLEERHLFQFNLTEKIMATYLHQSKQIYLRENLHP